MKDLSCGMRMPQCTRLTDGQKGFRSYRALHYMQSRGKNCQQSRLFRVLDKSLMDRWMYDSNSHFTLMLS